MPDKVLVNGFGTVGSRISHLLLSLDIPVVAVKRTANLNDIKTREMLDIYREFGEKIEIYMSDGDDYKERVEGFKEIGFDDVRPLSELDFDEIGYIIDASPKYMDEKNYEKIYKYHPDKNFMLQGGGDERNVYSCYLSAPNAKGATEFEELSKHNIKQVSCNTTFGATAIGLVLETENPEKVSSIIGYFIRRERDSNTKPGKPFKQAKGPETKFNTHHGTDIEKVLPQLSQKIKPTVALKCPWEHFHETVLNIQFNEEYDYENVENTFKNYSRSVTLESNFDMGDVINKINEMNIPDADCLFPLYHLRKVNSNTLEIIGLTPQRSIVAPSATDMVVKKILKPDATWEEAFDYVNKKARWHGYRFDTLKDKLKYKLSPEI